MLKRIRMVWDGAMAGSSEAAGYEGRLRISKLTQAVYYRTVAGHYMPAG
jgi:hypothetical protein